MSRISSRQQAILEFIKNEVREKGYPPSVREIGEAVGLASSSTVHGHLERLEKKGLSAETPPSQEQLKSSAKRRPMFISICRLSAFRLSVKLRLAFPLPLPRTSRIISRFQAIMWATITCSCFPLSETV